MRVCLPYRKDVRDACEMPERCRTAAILASFTPLATFRFQPSPTVAIHAINLSISNPSQFSALALTTITILDVGLGVGLGVARTHCAQVSQRWQPQRAAAATGAGGEATG